MQDIRYDRQLRLWGDHGQSSIQSTSVCVLGSTALATEITKNLILAGVKRVCIIDDAIVTAPDLGQNFFLTSEDLGKSRAKCVIVNLKELNPAVICESRSLKQAELLDGEPYRFLCLFSVVVAANSAIDKGDYISDLADNLFSVGIPFVYARVCGLLGVIRISVKEHFIIDSHEENTRPDLRLDKPFPALEEIVSDTKNIMEMTSEELKHTPYLLLYFKALELYRNISNNSQAFPTTYKERQNFIGCLWGLRRPDEKGNLDSENFDEAKAATLRSVQPTIVPSAIMNILQDEKCKKEAVNIWLLCYGLRMFVEKHGVLPLSGSLPDMASDTQRYTKLAKVFHEKAQQDAAEVLQYIRDAEKDREMNKIISENECFQFCKKAAYIRLQRGTAFQGNCSYKVLLEQIEALDDDAIPTPAIWLLLLSSSLRFAYQKLRFPGECTNMPQLQDLEGLKKHVTRLIETSEGDPDKILKKIPSSAFKEILRFANSEPHVVSSLIGGITAQEIIKLATKQYVPIDTTFIYDGISQNSETFRL